MRDAVIPMSSEPAMIRLTSTVAGPVSPGNSWFTPGQSPPPWVIIHHSPRRSHQPERHAVSKFYRLFISSFHRASLFTAALSFDGTC